MNEPRTGTPTGTVRRALAESTRAAVSNLGRAGWLVLGVGMTAAVWVTSRSGPLLIAATYAIALFFILLAAVIDTNEQRLPNVLTIGGGAVALVAFAGATILSAETGWWRAAAGGGIFATWILVTTVVVAGAYGLGDVKLAAFCGILVAWQSWTTLALGVLATQIAIAATLLLARARRQARAPLGPSFAAGTLLALAVAVV